MTNCKHIFGFYYILPVSRVTIRLVSLSLLLLNIAVSAWAKAPATAKIVFTSLRNGNLDIYIMNPDGSEQVRLTQHPTADSQPTWSPTGEQILFVSKRQDSVPDLFLMDTDGRNIRKVFKDTVHRTSPAYAPNGKKIAYLRDTERAIYTATITGEEEKQLVQVGKSNGEPDWSPNGTEIAFVSKIGTPIAGSQIRIINMKTNIQEILLPDELPLMRGPAWSPFWSPRADEIIYTRSEPVFQLFKLAVGGQLSKQLTHNGMNRCGDWFDPAALSIQSNVELLTTTWGKLKQR